jgi:hypothetical protein
MLLEKNMRNKFFIDKKLVKKIEKDLKKRCSIEEDLNKDLELFNEEIDDKTVLSIFKYIEDYGNKKQKGYLVEIQSRYENSTLLIDDTLKLADWYDKMCNFYNNIDGMDL